MVRCILLTGWSLDTVLSLDVLTFNALMHRLLRLTYQERSERVLVGAQVVAAGMTGKTQGLKKITDAWATAFGDDLADIAKKTGRDARAFLQESGLSRGGKI